MGVDDTGLVEERDERLVRRLDDHELQRVAVERDALERLQDRAERGTARDCRGRSLSERRSENTDEGRRTVSDAAHSLV